MRTYLRYKFIKESIDLFRNKRNKSRTAADFTQADAIFHEDDNPSEYAVKRMDSKCDQLSAIHVATSKRKPYSFFFIIRTVFRVLTFLSKK